MSSRKELAGVRIDICSLREALHKIEHYIQEDGLHAVEAVSMKTVVTAGEEEEVITRAPTEEAPNTILIAAISDSACRKVPPILGIRFDIYAESSVCGVIG